MKIVVLAGGGGTRLWPLSRESKPKQFSKIVGDKTMFEQTMDRFLKKYPAKDIYVCLNKDLYPQARYLAPHILEKNFIIEPTKRDTAPAMGLVAAYLYGEFADEPIAYVPADHYIADEEKFLNILDKADRLIRTTGKMVDIAIQPSFPSTVLGYTRIGKRIEGDLYEFLGHTEKPKFEVAKRYLEEGGYLWHASYYMWTPRAILEAFKNHSSGHYLNLEKIVAGYVGDNQEQVDRAFNDMERNSFDYAVTEKINPQNVLIFKGDFGWSDVGAFDVLYEAQRKNADEQDNVVLGKGIMQNAKGNLVYGSEDKLISVLGVDNLVVVDTKDVLLICPKSKAQEVKMLVEKLRENRSGKHL